MILLELAQNEVSTFTSNVADAVPDVPVEEGEGAAVESEDDGSGGAFNPITGEINWDCPCLGGMAHGPCGQQFRDAFSCFVYSEDEPKGINCVDRFKLMQDCFREHPDVYAEGECHIILHPLAFTAYMPL